MEEFHCDEKCTPETNKQKKRDENREEVNVCVCAMCVLCRAGAKERTESI